ncbi:MAG: class A beta-lactamase-related serine hydrolase [Planctomycetaceae bacterium]|nr:class A beta-lactamase-related serine hydrolase [Planctomycetaceae bacterium]
MPSPFVSAPLVGSDPNPDLKLHPGRWKTALRLVESWCDSGRLPAAALLVSRLGMSSGTYLFGRQSPAEGAPPIRPDAIFLIASITKPIVATGVLILAERGLLALDDRVEQFVPAFGQNGKHAVTVRNLLTHTSGLPDMLPDNIDLRVANAPLSAFVEGTCLCPLDFPPGQGVQYQSMGFAMLGEIIHQVSGKSCSQFLQDEIFNPLGMSDTALGAPASWFEGADPKVSRIAEIRLPEEQRQAPGWNWHSAYWRKLGVPWGGLLTTPADLARFAQMMLDRGAAPSGRILSPATVAAATRNQLEAMREVPADDRRCRPWGLGWRLNWSAHSANFGDFLGPGTYGHWGATGTVLWIDPDTRSFAILLTTQPQEPHGSELSRASNAIVAAFE